MTTKFDHSLAFTKQLIDEYDCLYQQHFAAGRFELMMMAKRELTKQRSIFGKLLKAQMGLQK
jgi:hypothetical protein